MNWFHVNTLDQTINLSLVTRIEWNYLERECFRTRVFFLESEYNLEGEPVSSYLDIFSTDDRLALRTHIGLDPKNWIPKATT